LDAARGFRSARGNRATPLPVRLQIPKIRVARSCGGRFDTSTGHYRSYIIVFTTLRT
jgi:hypothetical protein